MVCTWRRKIATRIYSCDGNLVMGQRLDGFLMLFSYHAVGFQVLGAWGHPLKLESNLELLNVSATSPRHLTWGEYGKIAHDTPDPSRGIQAYKPATYRRGAADEPTAVVSPSPRATPVHNCNCRALKYLIHSPRPLHLPQQD